MLARRFDPPSARDEPPVVAYADRACKGSKVPFYPEHATGYAAAIAVCKTCPHIFECLAWALETEQSFGVWGGTTPVERREILARAKH
jgi:hypothetical protein